MQTKVSLVLLFVLSSCVAGAAARDLTATPANLRQQVAASRRLVFRPGGIRPGDYAFRVGTAGSATLVLQTVLPALLLAEGESNLVLEGGTHNPLRLPSGPLDTTG